MLIENNLLTISVIILSILIGFLTVFFGLKRYFNLDEQGIAAFTIFLSIVFMGGSFIYISEATHVVIEVRADANSNFSHKYNRLIGNWIFNVNDKTINTSELPDYKTVVLNFSEEDLVIEPIIYSKSSTSTNGTRNIITVPAKDFQLFDDVIQYFFDYNKPPKSIKVKSHERETIRYWLHKI